MYNKFILDMHTHTLASGHAYGTIREMAQAAAEKGLELLGISEHAPGIPGTVDPFYYCNLSVVPRSLYGVEVIFGSEVNVLAGGHLSLDDEWLDKLDYAIAGIHATCYEDAGREANTDNLIACMRHPKIKFVSHPDDDHTPLDYERLVPAAKENGVALEVNNSSFLKREGVRLNYRENYRRMLALCKQHHAPIIVDSDAHDPSAVGGFDEARKFLQEQDFPEELILNVAADRLKIFISWQA